MRNFASIALNAVGQVAPAPCAAYRFSGTPLRFAYVAYQVNELGQNFWDVTFDKPGEIWLSTLLQSPPRQWLLTDSQAAKAEPEPFVGETQAWVFYNVPEVSTPPQAVWHLYRAETPL